MKTINLKSIFGSSLTISQVYHLFNHTSIKNSWLCQIEIFKKPGDYASAPAIKLQPCLGWSVAHFFIVVRREPLE